MEPTPEQIFNCSSDKEFERMCLDVFLFQYKFNVVYKQYVDALKINPKTVRLLHEIPFLPVDFFKTHRVVCGDHEPDIVFNSSGTTGTVRSCHYVSDVKLYETSFLKCFDLFFGPPQNYTFLALLPSYLEREGSSLIYMVQRLMSLSKNQNNGFYLNNHDELYKKLLLTEQRKEKVILFGVTFALIDFFDAYKPILHHAAIIETGGMKGRKKEMTRAELHTFLTEASGLKTVFSEYGMTELLSQAYSKGNNCFKSPPWMKILIRDVNDPFCYLPEGRMGGINIIDLANLYSCAFIETKDLGKMNPDGFFEVNGRFDHSDLRGCNFLVL